MKIATAILIILIFSGCAGPQKTAGVNDADAPMRTDVIYINSHQDQDELFSIVGNVLQQERFNITSSDKDLGSISTEPREFDDSIQYGFIGSMIYVRLSAYISDNEIRLQGRYRTPEFDFIDIEKYGASDSTTRSAWAVLHKVAENIADHTNGSISYE